ncbi:MAG: isoprenylcysteine carboxylmethyltransferase family protein [Steroidobacter sp.]
MIDTIHQYFFTALWIGWACFFWVASFDVKTAAQRENLSSRLRHTMPVAIGGALLGINYNWIPVLYLRFMPAAAWPFWIGAVLAFTGMLLALWARHSLGGNWSGTVTIKAEHELIVKGPYAIVRHPIYTGILLAFIGFAIAEGEWRSVLGVAIITTGLWYKLSLEERWMHKQFGNAYQDYCRRVPSLIPSLVYARK